jgi:hypothetical protein
MDHLTEAQTLLADLDSSEAGNVSNLLMCHVLVAIASDVRRLADAADPA